MPSACTDIDSNDQSRQPVASEKDAANPRGRCPEENSGCTQAADRLGSPFGGVPAGALSVHEIMIENSAHIGEAIIVGLGAGLLYGTVGYMANHRQTGDPFDPIHYASSLVVAMGAAVSLSLAGVAPTEAAIAEQLTLYAGLTYAVERVLRTIIPPEQQRRLRERANR